MKRIGFTVIAVAVIAACQNDRPFPPGPNAQIQDANHNAGNAFFFWLSPVVNQHAPATQVFSRQLSPVVTITNLCTGAVVRTFSGAAISVSNASYHVNWATAQDNLNSACTYRVTVTVGTKLMGFADVDVVDSGRELKNVNTNEFIPLLDDRTLPLQFFIGVGSQCARARLRWVSITPPWISCRFSNLTRAKSRRFGRSITCRRRSSIAIRGSIRRSARAARCWVSSPRASRRLSALAHSTHAAIA